MNRQIPEEYVSLAAVGDVYFGSLPDDTLDKVLPILREHDLRFCNLEGPVTERGASTKRFAHPMEARAIVAMKKAGFDVVSFANNHCLDYGTESFLHTLELLNQNDIAFVGAGKDLPSAQKPVFLESKGCRIGFLAYASVFDPAFVATEVEPGMAYVRVNPLYAPPHINEEDLRDMIANIKETKAQADVVVVYHHWGLSLWRNLAVYQKYLAHQTVDAGADIVLGGHSHILQGIELYQGKVICYCLGNFVFDSRLRFFTDATNESMILTCLIGDNEVKGVLFRPVVTNKLSQPEVVTPGEQMFKKIVATVSELSTPLGTLLQPEGSKIWIRNSTEF